jgi:hypothetical protein
MCDKNSNQTIDHEESFSDAKDLVNILRILSMLEKALNRTVRQKYYARRQYPEIFFQIENTINSLRTWIQTYQVFCMLTTFNMLLEIYIKEIEHAIEQLIENTTPLNGKKRVSQSRLINEHKRLCQSLDNMVEHLGIFVRKSDTKETEIGIEFEKALLRAFEKHCFQIHDKKVKAGLSMRGDKTYIFPFSQKDDYASLVRDKERFCREVIEKLGEYAHETGHKDSCKGPKYRLRGFRQNNRKTVMPGGHQEEFPIRMVECLTCHERFSLLPSFLPREKHFCIDIIGSVLEGILRFGQSLQAALQSFKISGGELKSKQTLLNWLRWMGSLHPARVLTRAGIKGSGYLQEDEGFEKEPNLRTYTVCMVDSENLLVWHADYVDHVKEEILCRSFEEFIEEIDFKVLGITKDKWKASTNALKKVFYRLWIGFCHLHCLKNFRKALSDYQKETGCTERKVKKLYKEFKELLERSSSKLSLEVKLKSLEDEAFEHPLLRQRLEELKKNAPHYTCHKSRKGISKTTSIVDNYLKGVKRKLRQVESFRDQDCTHILFRAMANARNFMPFLPGAKHAHRSPFMLAGGDGCDLPWIQVMNMHNAFLFTADAF